MHKVIKIIGVEDKVTKSGKHYKITHLLTNVGQECTYFGTNVAVGDEVMVAYHRGNIKAIKKP